MHADGKTDLIPSENLSASIRGSDPEHILHIVQPRASPHNPFRGPQSARRKRIATHRAMRQFNALPRTRKRDDVLTHLASSPREVFSRADLLRDVWQSSPDWQDPATVTVHVRRIRNKIEADPEKPRWITTVWGVGYRFEP